MRGSCKVIRIGSIGLLPISAMPGHQTKKGCHLHSQRPFLSLMVPKTAGPPTTPSSGVPRVPSESLMETPEGTRSAHSVKYTTLGHEVTNPAAGLPAGALRGSLLPLDEHRPARKCSPAGRHDREVTDALPESLQGLGRHDRDVTQVCRLPAQGF